MRGLPEKRSNRLEVNIIIKRRYILFQLTLVVIMTMSLIACRGKSADSSSYQMQVDSEKDRDIRVIITSGLNKNGLFKVGTRTCTRDEFMVYLTNMQNSYEEVYTDEFWQVSDGNATMEERLKETALSKISQTKAICALADEMDITLDDTDIAKTDQLAKEYYETLNDTELELMGTSERVISNLYQELVLSDKVYEEIIKDINTEISDDEARTITVQHIMIRTVSTDEFGNMRDYNTEELDDAYERISELYSLVTDKHKDFETVARQYSEDMVITYSFGKGEMDGVFETESFKLGKGEISNIVKTREGYHIIKCISTFNREVTDSNKDRILDKRKQTAFQATYDEFVKTVPRLFNDKLWDSITIIRDERVSTSSFFDKYDEY